MSLSKNACPTKVIQPGVSNTCDYIEIILCNDILPVSFFSLEFMSFYESFLL